ncbi:hypothetical protein BRD19_00820 [Halobacteriales archaeon SW_7_65_23]|nr:MAG: hypothetical protein BRD19_00820 [Halobacteriales archaeon SW_7_65_23]
MPQEDIIERVLEGGEYERAKATVNRTFAMPIRTKIAIAIAGLLVTLPVAPAIVLRRTLIVAYEGTDTLELVLGRLALLGMATVFLAGLLLIRQRHVLLGGSLSAERARKLLRIEDLLMWFVIRVYAPTTALGVDIRFVSALGAFMSQALFLLHMLSFSAS